MNRPERAVAAASPLHLACAGDDRYAPHTAAMLHSALAHRGDCDVHVHLLHADDLSAENADKLRTMVERSGGAISFVRVDLEQVGQLPRMEHATAATWYRIYLPELLALPRVLYLDSDTVVVDSLEPLWATDLGEHYVAAVTNVFQDDGSELRPAVLGLAGPEVYFNGGVLMMNLDAMRRDRCTEALLECAFEYRFDLPWGDQDPLNVVLSGRRLPLHPRWNCMNSIERFPWSADVFGADVVAEAVRHPAILHFEGPGHNKPWHYMCDRPGRAAYREHRSATPWPRLRLEGVTPANVARKWLRRAGRPAAA